MFLRKNGVQKRSVLAVRDYSITGFDEKNTRLNFCANMLLHMRKPHGVTLGEFEASKSMCLKMQEFIHNETLIFHFPPFFTTLTERGRPGRQGGASVYLAEVCIIGKSLSKRLR